MLTLNDGRSELWQWDTGRTLAVDADCSQVHFSNKVFGRSIDVDVIDGIAIIPDTLLQTDKDLNVWAFVGTAENGYTKISKTFKVNRRNKPADYVFTPPDQTSLEEIKEKIDYLESIQDPDAIKNAVADYISKNPITVEETDPTVPAWAKEAQKPSYTASEVGADPSGTAAAQVTAHNTAEAAHNDIRLLISGLTDRLDALADSDDTTLDQLSEVVAYIKSNRSLIDAITTSKVSVADIVDDLTTNVSNKPLSAAQGVALKALIDAITIPDTLPNPNALTFTGAVTGTYDGSAPLSVDIPSGGGGSGGGITGFRRVVDTTLTEAAEIVNLTTDINGNTFSLSECYLFIEAACTEQAPIVYIPNGYWNVGTYMTSGSKTATDYPYIYIAYACGGSDHFFGFELRHRTGVSMPNYNSNKSDYWKPITSYKLSGKFAKGARFIIIGRDA